MLDDTAKISNFVFSIKKYIVETLWDNEKIQVVFDQFLYPGDDTTKWCFVLFDSISRDTVSNFSFEIFCIIRQDFESEVLHDFVDTVIGYFVDQDEIDGLKRIPFYVKGDITEPIGYLLPYEVQESSELYAQQDNSKYIRIRLILKMATK